MDSYILHDDTKEVQTENKVIKIYKSYSQIRHAGILDNVAFMILFQYSH